MLFTPSQKFPHRMAIWLQSPLTLSWKTAEFYVYVNEDGIVRKKEVSDLLVVMVDQYAPVTTTETEETTTNGNRNNDHHNRNGYGNGRNNDNDYKT